MRMALPGYSEFRRIFRAQVPIITFRHSYTNLCCDLSIQSNDSIIAAQLFFTYTLLDPRVRPLLFALRRWSIAQGLSSFVTNFPLCCLALFYLMEERVVPPMNQALDDSSGNVSSIPTSIRWSSPNTSTMEDLLRGFFRFYAHFNFQRDAISVFLGKRTEKLTTDSIEVENPIDRKMNCARLFEHAHGFPSFHAAIVAADSTLEQNNRPPPLGVKATKKKVDSSQRSNWGLTCLIEELYRKSDLSEAEVFMDSGEDPSIEADGLLGGGTESNSEPRSSPRKPSKTRSKPSGEVLSILNDIFEGDVAKERDAGTLTSTTSTTTTPPNDEDLCLNPTRYVEDDEVEMIGELGAGVGAKNERSIK